MEMRGDVIGRDTMHRVSTCVGIPVNTQPAGRIIREYGWASPQIHPENFIQK